VPVQALRHGPRGDFVWIARADGTVISKGVTAGQADSGRVLIERGLDRGTRVVTEGHFRLEDNTKVEVVRNGGASPSATQPPVSKRPG
jgi:multidrug efflux system membrane fusion protein